MLKDTRMTSFLNLHQMAKVKGVTQENIWAVVLGYYIYTLYMTIIVLCCHVDGLRKDCRQMNCRSRMGSWPTARVASQCVSTHSSRPSTGSRNERLTTIWRYVITVEPQQQALNWIKKREADHNLKVRDNSRTTAAGPQLDQETRGWPQSEGTRRQVRCFYCDVWSNSTVYAMIYCRHWPPIAPDNYSTILDVKITRFCHFQLPSISLQVRSCSEFTSEATAVYRHCIIVCTIRRRTCDTFTYR